ncbi:MAG: GTP cyclohydrolase II [Rhodobacterales bacterium]|nr:MAG: GTP cyclohydrolase II [Rhodobacterales bacterium]
MRLTPTPDQILSRARADVRVGLPVVLTHGAAAALVVAVETLEAAHLQQLITAPGTLILAMTAWRCQSLNLPAPDGDLARIALPDAVDLAWLRRMVEPFDDTQPLRPAPAAPLRQGRDDFARAAIALAKAAQLLPAALVLEIPGGAGFAAAHNLTYLRLEESPPLLSRNAPLALTASAGLPLSASNAAQLHVFRPNDGSQEHYAVEIGQPDRNQPVLVRLHSACFTGDVLSSLKCDCGPQLQGALKRMGQDGAGVLLYLNQEGRGIGLANKMRAYGLQNQGFDTVEANHRLGFEDDERDFRIGADMLKGLGITQINLLTNNPAKVDILRRQGITVCQRIPLRVGQTAENSAYLHTKSTKSGHLL